MDKLRTKAWETNTQTYIQLNLIFFLSLLIPSHRACNQTAELVGGPEPQRGRCQFSAVPKTLKGHPVSAGPAAFHSPPPPPSDWLIREIRTIPDADWPGYSRQPRPASQEAKEVLADDSPGTPKRLCAYLPRCDIPAAWLEPSAPVTGLLPDPRGSRSNSHTHPRAAPLALLRAAGAAQSPPPPFLPSALAVVCTIPTALCAERLPKLFT